jgi:hypothetical protein
MPYFSQGLERGFFSDHQVLSTKEQYRCGHEAESTLAGGKTFGLRGNFVAK